MHGTGSNIKTGLSLVPELESVEFEQSKGDAKGKYWGIYRDRVPEHEHDGFESPFAVAAEKEKERGEQAPKPRRQSRSLS
jgi:hypothetical protein